MQKYILLFLIVFGILTSLKFKVYSTIAMKEEIFNKFYIIQILKHKH